MFTFVLDIVLTAMLGVGIYFAVRLSRQIAGLRASREEMERFVLDFSTTVERAEAGVRGLKQAARSSGDDLEQLIEKAQAMRDELHLLIASADQIATRLGDAAGTATRSSSGGAETKDTRESFRTSPGSLPKAVAALAAVTKASGGAAAGEEQGADVSSAAERELLQALRKLG